MPISRKIRKLPPHKYFHVFSYNLLMNQSRLAFSICILNSVWPWSLRKSMHQNQSCCLIHVFKGFMWDASYDLYIVCLLFILLYLYCTIVHKCYCIPIKAYEVYSKCFNNVTVTDEKFDAYFVVDHFQTSHRSRSRQPWFWAIGLKIKVNFGGLRNLLGKIHNLTDFGYLDCPQNLLGIQTIV